MCVSYLSITCIIMVLWMISVPPSVVVLDVDVIVFLLTDSFIKALKIDSFCCWCCWLLSDSTFPFFFHKILHSRSRSVYLSLFGHSTFVCALDLFSYLSQRKINSLIHVPAAQWKRYNHSCHVWFFIACKSSHTTSSQLKCWVFFFLHFLWYVLTFWLTLIYCQTKLRIFNKNLIVNV